MKRKWVLVTIAALLAVGAGVFYWYQTRPTHTERFYEPTPDQAKITRDARKAYATLDMTPVEAFADLQAAETYFEQVPIQDPQPGTTQIPAAISEAELAEAKGKLRTVMAQFVHYRLTTTGDLERDADRYLAWRHNRGDVVKPRDDRWLYWEETYEGITGSPLPPNIDLDRAYKEVHIAADEQKPPTSRIVAISTDPNETLFVTYWAHTHISSDHPIINHQRGSEYWQGGQSGGFSTWFRCALHDPRDDTRVQVQLIALAGIVVEAKDGSRYPIGLGLVWNPQTKDWMISGLGVVNADMAKIQGFIF